MLVVSVAGLMVSGCLPSNGERDGTIRVNGQEYAVPEKIDGVPLPADPGEKGKATLLGVDANSNGVRDDVERYIAARFQGYKHAAKERSIAMQYGRVIQKVLEGGKEKAFETEKLMARAGECSFYMEENILTLQEQKGFDIFDADYKDIVFNTKERLITYLEYNQALSGHGFSIRIIPRLEMCDNDLNKI
jgi:hypothetical protein